MYTNYNCKMYTRHVNVNNHKHTHSTVYTQPVINQTDSVPCCLSSPVCPNCQRTSACSIWATCRGMALSSLRLEWRPVACQKPKARERLVRRSGRDDCHDCHFWVQRVSLLQAAPGSGTEKKGWQERKTSRTISLKNTINEKPRSEKQTFSYTLVCARYWERDG